jgi:tryptophan 2,3-dioxygenase
MAENKPKPTTASVADFLAALEPERRRNELLLIIQHQASELWLKLLVHELRSAGAGHVAWLSSPASLGYCWR